MGKCKSSLLAAVAAATLLAGCMGPITREGVGPGREVVLPPPISAAEVEARTARLARRLEQTKMGEREKQVAMALMNSYQIIGATLQPPMAEGDRQRVIRLLFDSLSKMDEEYFLKESVDEKAYSKIFEQYSSYRKEIIQDYLAGDHEKVVNKSTGLRDLFGEEALTPDVALLFSISLSKQGRLTEAVTQGERVMRDLEQRPDLVNLRAYILEWQLAMGQETSAQESLNELVRRVDEKEAVLKEAKQKIGGQGKVEWPAEVRPELGAPSAVSGGSHPLGRPESLDGTLAEVRGLIAKKEYTKAKFLLLQQRIRFPEGPDTEALDNAMREVELAQEKGDERPVGSTMQKAVADTERLVLVKKLVEEESFEEALAKLNEIQPEGSSSTEVNSLREVATEKLINKERNRAAKLYLMAKNEGNLAKKEELLVSSFNILKSLLDKYPTSTLKKKINENMSTIKDEMGRIKMRSE
jgi:hypothetical protein